MSNTNLHYLKATHNSTEPVAQELLIMSNTNLHYLKATHNSMRSFKIQLDNYE